MDANPSAAAPANTKCVACGEDILKDAKMCGKCKFPVGKVVTGCVNCGKLIPLGTPFCSDCKLYQSRLRYFPASATVVALVAAFIGVISAVIPAVSYFLERNSHTRFKVTGSSKTEIYLKAWNTGRKPSTLLDYRLRFDRLPLPKKEVMLELNSNDKEEARNVIAPGAPVRLRLSRVTPDTIPMERRSNQCTPQERRRMFLRNSPMTLEIDVEESNDRDRRFQTRKDRFASDRIAEFFREQGGD
ncbi:MAG TPA: zinc ribbon domain-containing protein [Thermoanaerobaculia bacterium]|nr:zinc ribbon domain-containing protein [Thermoanaerobaculia bacterium]